MTYTKQNNSLRAPNGAFAGRKIKRDAAPGGAQPVADQTSQGSIALANSGASRLRRESDPTGVGVGGRASSSKSRTVELLETRQHLAANPWGWQGTLIGQDLAAANYPSITGAGYSVVVIDSGIDYKHPNLGGAIGAGHKVVAGWDFDGNDANPFTDTDAHGTGSAAMIAGNAFDHAGNHYSGIAPGANLIALRVRGADDIKQAFEWVHANKAKYNIAAVNYVDLTIGNATTYKAALKQVIADGVFVSRPTGNSGPTQYLWPAMDAAEWFVGSVNSAGAISNFSTRGTEMDMLAPGEKVTLPYYNVLTGQHTIVSTADGTSWASPQVVGAAVLIKQVWPGATPQQIMQVLKDSGTPTYDAVTKVTYKRLNVNAAIGLAYQRHGGAVPAPVPQAPASSGPPAGATQSPYGGTAFKINASGVSVLQAENFDAGIDSVAYHDLDATNRGNDKYRTGTGVDVFKNGNTRLVSHAWAGEWLEYTTDVAAPGTYTFTAAVASQGKGGTFHLEIDGVNVSGTIGVGNTGGWLTTGAATKAGISLTAGRHTIRVVMDTNSATTGAVANFDAFKFTPTGAITAKPAATPAPTTTTANYNALSGFHAYQYSGQSGVTAWEGVLGWVDAGDWVGYTGVDFGATGATKMNINLSVPAAYAGKKIVVRTDSPTGAVLGTLTVKSTGSWGNFQTQTLAISKTTGVKNVYLTFEGGPAVANLNYIGFAA